jgi:hypothetical protein
MGHIKGERHDDFDRLHYPDGSHRGAAASANGRELDWFDVHHRAHLAKHREQGEEPRFSGGIEREPVRYVWTMRDLDEVAPQIGTLAEYAKACEMAEISGSYAVSSSVWTWDDEGRPVEHIVETKRGSMTEGQHIPIEYRTNNETVIHLADGAA